MMTKLDGKRCLLEGNGLMVLGPGIEMGAAGVCGSHNDVRIEISYC